MVARRFAGVVLVILVVAGLVAVSGAIGYRVGWSDGVLAQHTVADGAEGGATLLPSPALSYAPGHLFHGPILGVLGVLFIVLLFVMLIGLAMKVFAFHVWQTAGGPGTEFWAHKWHKNHGRGPVPPWCHDWAKPSASKAGASTRPAESEGKDSDRGE